MPNIVGGGLSLGAPGVEHVKSRFQGAAAGLFNGVVLEVSLMVIFVWSTPQRCFLVVWVVCRHCRSPHYVRPPFLGAVLFVRWRRRRRRRRSSFMMIRRRMMSFLVFSVHLWLEIRWKLRRREGINCWFGDLGFGVEEMDGRVW